MRPTISSLMFINPMKKAFSKLRQCLRCFWEYIKHIDKILLIFVFFLGTFVALAVAVMVSDSVACYLQELLGLSEKDEVLKFIGFCIAGVVSIWLALSADKRANAMDATAKNTKEEQRQERLKNAIEHLGHDKDSVRMGGAYELFHLAKDTEDLRRTVFDILCAHIRQTTRGNAYQAEHKTKPSEEIQSLLTLLFMDEHDVFEDCPINLQGSYLIGASLTKAKLYGATLDDAQLQWTDLIATQLQEADLNRARLQGADLRYAQLQGASLRYARLQRADLMNAQLQGAILWAARLQGASLWATQLQGAVLENAQLQRATLMDARIQGADLMHAGLQGANLMNAQLQGANLSLAQLQGVSSHTAYPHPAEGFESTIINRIGEPSNLTGIIFAGGLKQEDLDTLCEGLSDDQAQALRKKLRSHVGKPANNELPENSGAVTAPPSPPYTQEEAERWITEYNKAMDEAPRADDTANADSAPNSAE